eukprot:6178498-Pleurochrysis_carterae.AAC.3
MIMVGDWLPEIQSSVGVLVRSHRQTEGVDRCLRKLCVRDFQTVPLLHDYCCLDQSCVGIIEYSSEEYFATCSIAFYACCNAQNAPCNI